MENISIVVTLVGVGYLLTVGGIIAIGTTLLMLYAVNELKMRRQRRRVK